MVTASFFAAEMSARRSHEDAVQSAQAVVEIAFSNVSQRVPRRALIMSMRRLTSRPYSSVGTKRSGLKAMTNIR
jgi:hypothetical protein